MVEIGHGAPAAQRRRAPLTANRLLSVRWEIQALTAERPEPCFLTYQNPAVVPMRLAWQPSQQADSVV